MPITKDIMDHKVLGREYKRGIADGMRAGQLRILRIVAAKKFGEVPAWAEERMAGLSAEELESFSLRLPDAASLAELLP